VSNNLQYWRLARISWERVALFSNLHCLYAAAKTPVCRETYCLERNKTEESVVDVEATRGSTVLVACCDHRAPVDIDASAVLGSARVNNRHFSRPLHRAFSGGLRNMDSSVRHYCAML